MSNKGTGLTVSIRELLRNEPLTLVQISEKLPQYLYLRVAVVLGRLVYKGELEHPKYGGVYKLRNYV